MPEGWRKLKWGDIATLEYGKSLNDYKKQEGEIPVYGTNGLIGYTDKPLCQFPSIIIGRKGAYRGVHFSKVPFFVIDTAFYLNPRIKDLDLRFAYYQLLIQNINEMDSGSAIPSTSRNDFYNLDLLLPDFRSQQKISTILFSLDDKIELNLRMNKTLEAIAQAIFKEWFVDFRFPGFDGELVDAVNTDGSVSRLPNGWRKGKIEEIYQTTSGGTPSRSNESFFKGGTIKWVKSKELNNSFIIESEETITTDALKNSSAKLLPRYSLLIAMYGATVGEYAILSTEATCNQAICAILPNDKYPFTYIHRYFVFYQSKFINKASGSAQQNISQALIQKSDILIPPPEIATMFHDIVLNLYEKIENNLIQNICLQNIRDLLLPKLMTGKIRVA